MLRHRSLDGPKPKATEYWPMHSKKKWRAYNKRLLFSVISVCFVFFFVHLELRWFVDSSPFLPKRLIYKERSSLNDNMYSKVYSLDHNTEVSYDVYQHDIVGQRISVTDHLREKPVRFDIYRDAMYSLSGEVELNGLDDEYSVEQSHRLIMYNGNHKLNSLYKPTPIFPSSTIHFDVSVITQTSYERLFYFPHLLQCWKGPINAAVFLKDDEMKIFTQFIKSTPLSNRLHITLYEVLPIEQSIHQCVVYYKELTPVPTNSTPFDSSIVYGTLTAEGLRRRFQRICNDNSEPIYPINRLRNIAINSITTTHFLVVDMDMWPVENTYEDLISLPSSVLRNEHLALILPAFSLKSSSVQDCSSFQDCVEKTIHLLPRNKTELKQCIDNNLCSTFRPETNTHNYLSDDWYDLPKSTRFMFKRCFNHVFQEPYIMVRRSNHLPLFDERFINYGYNKVQWIEHLRWIGYQFGVIAQSFATDIPHPPSNYANTWNKLWEVKNNPNITMRTVYRKFLTELRTRTNDDSTVFVCHRYANRYTKNIAVNHQDMKDRKVRVDEAKKKKSVEETVKKQDEKKPYQELVGEDSSQEKVIDKEVVDRDSLQENVAYKESMDETSKQEKSSHQKSIDKESLREKTPEEKYVKGIVVDSKKRKRIVIRSTKRKS